MTKLTRKARPGPIALAAATAAVTAVALVATPTTAAADDDLPDNRTDLPQAVDTENFTDGRYIVQLAGDPVATYEGDVSGLAATAPDEGDKIDQDSSNVSRYRNYLEELRAEALDDVPGADVVGEFDTAFNGFTVELTAGEAAAMSKASNVVNIWPEETLKLDTASTPDFLGLTGDDGVWSQQFGGDEHAGEGMIVGVLDTGFWPENPSFAPLSEPRPDQDVIDAKWNGECVAGDDTAENNVTCNNKVIGARYYNAAGSIPDGEFLSPRDFNGHGSHTASTAAGNHGVETPLGDISGMAPSARLAIYKVCYADGCSSTDSVAAIEDAVNDGVDVLNYSVSGSTEFIVDPVHIAFFNAAAAGVFVANSAGNDGPGASTVAHNTPWITTVANGTHDRFTEADLTLGNGDVFTGAMLGEPLPETEVVMSTEVGLDGADPLAVSECHIGSLDADKVDGRAVACARGGNPFVEKGDTVTDAGGAALITFNVPGGSTGLIPIQHAIPAIHVDIDAGEALTAYAASTDTPTVAISEFEITSKTAPDVWTSSSAGPAIAGGGDLLKPDIMAPGTEVYAAVAPPDNDGADFASYTGTSMSSPHIAGLGALLMAQHPDWSPAAIRSAMMTTAQQTNNEGEPFNRSTGDDADPFDFGAGQVDPPNMFDPGLVYDSDAVDWLQYGCSIDQFQLIGYEELCDDLDDEYGAMDPSNLNYPSISIGKLVGSQTVTRTVTNVSDKVGVYFITIDAPQGTTVTADRRVLVVKPGQTASYELTITRTDAALGEYTFGSVTLKDLRDHEVRSPITVKPEAVDVPDLLAGNGTSGSAELAGVAGYDGELSTQVTGLSASDVEQFNLSNPTGGSFPTGNPVESDHTMAVQVTTPAEADLVRFATFDADHPAGTDLDLFVYIDVGGGQLVQVGQSATGTSNETVTFTGAGGFTFVIFVDLWASNGSQPVDTVFHSWQPVGEAGNLTLDPASQPVSPRQEFAFTANWSGLEPDSRYLGLVQYNDGSQVVAESMVTVNT